MKIKILILASFFIIFFTGCVKQDDIKGVFQSNSAILIRHDHQSILNLLTKFKNHLNARNPKQYNKKLVQKIKNAIKNPEKFLYIKYKNTTLKSYNEYMQLAFSKSKIPNRNDYLILGMYYMIFDAYNLGSIHKITALQYDEKKLQKLYKNLQILKWKIKRDKDLNNNYLFLTWQNNWQVELEKKTRKKSHINYNIIKKLKYIKNKKESIFNSSNFTFEIILTQMIDKVGDSIKALGKEPSNLAIETLGMFLFL